MPCIDSVIFEYPIMGATTKKRHVKRSNDQAFSFQSLESNLGQAT